MTTSRFLSKGDILGNLFRDGEAYFRIMGVAMTNLEAGGTAGNYGYIANCTPGTASGWYNVINASNRHELVPESRGWIYHWAFGISPSTAEIYIQYPKDIDRRYLYRSLSVGTVPAGMIRGQDYPYDTFDIGDDNEFFTLHNELEPAFNAYVSTNFATTSDSVPVKLRFIGRKYKIQYLKSAEGLDTSGMTQAQRQRILANAIGPNDARRVYFREIGDGVNPVDAPDWIAEYMRS